MRCQPSSVPGRCSARRGKGCGILILAAVSLGGCTPEGGKEEAAVRDVRDVPPQSSQIDRTFKTDRLDYALRAPVLRELPQQTRRSPDPGPYASLTRFYRALGDLKSGLRSEPVTVLHLGDSHIAADRFSGDLRALFQARFGDAGRGMMMPGFPFPYYRARGVTFAKKGAWASANSFQGDDGPYGLSGVRLSAAKKNASLSLTLDDGAAEWAEVTFARSPGGGDVSVSFGGVKRALSTAGKEGEAAHVRIASKGRELKLATQSNNPVSVLSWSVGNNRPGLRYVNFGIPGATADTPRRWSQSLVRAGLQRLKPDLIVLGYGTNEGFNDGLDIAAYESRVTKLIEQLRDGAPQADILIMGPPDSARLPRFARKAKKAASTNCVELTGEEIANYASLKAAKSPKLARWHAPPSLSRVRHALEDVAAGSNAYFWDWSQVMGGPCGIHEWATANPPLAASDHVHLRSAGAKRSAQALFSEIMKGYEAHVRLASR